MVLIDATNINTGGALLLLRYLVSEMTKQEIQFYLLCDERLTLREFDNKIASYHSVNFVNRKKILKNAVKKINPGTILVFGNYPLSFKPKSNIKVYTYFHNSHLVSMEGKVSMGFINRVILTLKKAYINKFKNNTDYFIVQNEVIREAFNKTYKYSKKRILKLPFFDDKKYRKIFLDICTKKRADLYIYPSLPGVHKNHLFLFEVWEILKNKYNQSPLLMVTIPKDENNKDLLQEIVNLNKIGVNIKNLGYIEHKDLLNQIGQSEYCIYPSLLETLGLGIIESIYLKCKVLISDLPYAKDILVPSMIFSPYSAADLAYKIFHCKKLEYSNIIVENKIEELINLLIKKNE